MSAAKVVGATVAAAWWIATRSAAQVPTTNFFNFETPPVSPIALSPDGSRLAVCNLPAGRVEFFDVTSGQPQPIGGVAVGIDPVTVRFRTATELWVANYISDSISIVDLPTLRVMQTLTTSNEPSDIVFAGLPQRGYVSCGQPNLVQVFDPIARQVVTNLIIDGNRPRALAVSPDGGKVYVAIFESGNATTIITPEISALEELPRPSPISFPSAPSGGMNPPPNSGTNFVPAINAALGTNQPPRVGLIVRRNAAGRWLDDNQHDWTEYIRGTNAAFTGRVPGWDLPDHDLAVINTTTFAVRYATGLMNICMAVGVDPQSGQIAVVGTDSINETRFQSNLNGIFTRVNIAQVDPQNLTSLVGDLNPHLLPYASASTSDALRTASLGDPRGVVWSANGSELFVTGMGSDNLVILDRQNNRVGDGPINLDAGPTGMALDSARQRLYVFCRFADSIDTVDLTNQVVTNSLPLWDPTPAVIKAGRPFLYNTHLTSGLGQVACASCHVDARFDRLAWDLGDPAGTLSVISNANFVGNPPANTNNYHPMKGPMVTMTLVDIVGHEPFHWRGDRMGIEQFQQTFTNLQGSPVGVTDAQMQSLKQFLGTIGFAPNPYRQIDNSLATNLPLPGIKALGRGVLPAGAQLPNGNAQNGQAAFRSSAATGCIACHTLPAGLGTDLFFSGGHWNPFPLGINSSHHSALIELPRSANLPFKVPQLRNLFDKLGADFAITNSRAGFGFFHDGGADTLPRFIQDSFGITDDQATADLVAFLFSFTGSDLPPGLLTDPTKSPGLASLDTPASVGRQWTMTNVTAPPFIGTMISLALSSTGRVDLIVKGREGGLARGWFFNTTSRMFQSDRAAELESSNQLFALAGPGVELTFTLVPKGAGHRLGIDEDNDGYLDRDELDFGSDPANPLSLATNRPPILVTPANLTVLAGRPIALSITATDLDVPAQTLTFSLGTNTPAGASINATNGLFAWTPDLSFGGTTNRFTVTVTDNGKPNLSSSGTFDIVVLNLNVTALSVGTHGTTIQWTGAPQVTYRLQYKNDLMDPAWQDVPGDVTASGLQMVKTDATPATNNTRFYRIVALP